MRSWELFSRRGRLMLNLHCGVVQRRWGRWMHHLHDMYRRKVSDSSLYYDCRQVVRRLCRGYERRWRDPRGMRRMLEREVFRCWRIVVHDSHVLHSRKLHFNCRYVDS